MRTLVAFLLGAGVQLAWDACTRYRAYRKRPRPFPRSY